MSPFPSPSFLSFHFPPFPTFPTMSSDLSGPRIAKAMDAWRIRLWLKEGPRCPCRCGERIPWSVAKAVDVEAFEKRKHIPTERRPYWGVCHVEKTYIPTDVRDFPAYLVERRHVVRTFSELLWQMCLTKTEDWMLALLKNGHATWLWRTPQCCSYQTPSKVFDLVKRDWRAAADIMLSWPTTVAAFTRNDIHYLVRLQPAIVFFEHIAHPFTTAQRNWILHHPTMTEKTRKIRANRNWLFVLLWTVYVRSKMWTWKKARAPLPVPSKEAIPTFVSRIESDEYSLHPGTSFYKELLIWVAFLAKECPGSLRKLLPKLGYKTQWLIDVIETLAPTGRVCILKNALWIFSRSADMLTQKEKIWQWINNPAFANPRIAKTLITAATFVIQWATQNNQKKGLVRKLLEGEVIVSTIDHTAVWLSNKMSEDTLLNFANKRNRRRHAVLSAALQNTPRFQKVHRIATLKATVYLTLFFRNHVRLAQARAAHRGDCPICYAPKILQPLHGDKRHGMCLDCKRQMERNRMLDRCPMCRVNL